MPDVGQCPLVAHSPSEKNHAWHALSDHLRDTGELAGSFAEAWGGDSFARWLGITHDVGKASGEWQEGLREVVQGRRERIGVDHKAPGAGLGHRLAAVNTNAPLLAAAVVLGHHHGMPDMHPTSGADVPLDALRAEKEGAHASMISAIQGALELDFQDLASDVSLPGFVVGDGSLYTRDRSLAHRLDVFARMSHSALVDADWLDTSRHFAGRDRPLLTAVADFGLILERFTDRYENLRANAPATPLNLMRGDLFDASVQKAALDPGIFRMPAPTGSGKTLSAAAFALHHALRYNKHRVIVAVPFTSITTQNAVVFRDFVDPDDTGGLVLEHHSAILDTEVATDPWRRAVASNWDAPFIVTTTVQLLESLFSNRPSATRKLHRIANSVVVLDEVQSLPMRLLPQILAMLRELVDNYGVTVLLSSATQPAFWSLPVWEGLPVSTIGDAHRSEAARGRVSFTLPTARVTWPGIADEVASLDRCLTIVNTTAAAQELHELVAARSEADVLHLSTRMCGNHRRDVIGRVRALLDHQDPVHLIATQLIEAGVDLDFPHLFREMAPADSILQAAGRCNRNASLSTGQVVVFEVEGARMPGGEYKAATELTRQHFMDRGVALNDPDALTSYYEALCRAFLPGGDSTTSSGINEARATLAFATTADLFRMIEDEYSVAVVITTYGTNDDRDEVTRILEALRNRAEVSPEEMRYLQGFSATVPAKRAVEETTAAGQHLEWLGHYHPQRGCVFTGSTDAFIF